MLSYGSFDNQGPDQHGPCKSDKPGRVRGVSPCSIQCTDFEAGHRSISVHCLVGGFIWRIYTGNDGDQQIATDCSRQLSE
jgi:hypothetical protein